MAHHDDPVADIDELLGVGRGEEDARGRASASSDQMRLISRRAPTSTPRVGIDHDQNAGFRSEPAGDLHLLLIAAGQRVHLGVDRRCLDAQQLDLVDRSSPAERDVEQAMRRDLAKAGDARYCR